MKLINILTLIISLTAIGVSSFTLLNRDPMAEPVYGKDAKEIAIEMLSRPRWDGTSKFFDLNRQELIGNLEVANFLETNGVGIAFMRTKVSDKTLQFCLWMHKTNSEWEWVPYLSHHISSDDFKYEWIMKNQEWLEDMAEKKEQWVEQSNGVW